MQFYASSDRFRDINILRFWTSKNSPMSMSTIFAMTQFHRNVKIYKCLPHNFASALTIWEYNFFLNFIPSKSQGQGVQFSQWHHSMANVQIQKCLPHTFALPLTISGDIKIVNFVPPKSRSRSWSAIFRNYTIQWQISKSTNASYTFLR